MLRLALQEYSFFEVCELEAKRKENSYTKVSLSILKEEYPEYEFFFIMGADSFFELEIENLNFLIYLKYDIIKT